MKKVPYLKDQFPQFEIGEHSYGRIKILGEGNLSIGKFCSFADGTIILLGVEHRYDWTTTYPFSAIWPEVAHIPGHPWSKGPIKIGNAVWVGQNSTILSDVTIGNGAIIGAGSVVTKDVSPFTIVAGNPARYIRTLFDPETIFNLEHIAWWDWPKEQIVAELPWILQKPDAFIKKYFNGGNE